MLLNLENVVKTKKGFTKRSQKHLLVETILNNEKQGEANLYRLYRL